MSVILSPHVEALVQQKIEGGRYNSPDEVIREALLALDEREGLIRLREAIAIGDAELARGEGIPYSTDLLDEIAHDAELAIRRGEQPSSDVIP